jgi:hypothetical protein
MSTADIAEFTNVLDKVRSWPPAMRLTLAEEVLRSLHPALRPNGRQGVPADQVRGIGAGEGPAPDEETVRQWIEERRTEKYG